MDTATQNARDARPDHFDAAMRHAMSLLATGMPRSFLATMARGCAKRGFTDAAAGYDHALLAAHGEKGAAQ